MKIIFLFLSFPLFASTEYFFSPEIETLKLQKVKDENTSQQVEIFENKTDAIRIHIKDSKLSRTEAEAEIKKLVLKFKSNFEASIAPYSGMVTSRTECLNKVDFNQNLSEDNSSISIIFNLKTENNHVINTCDDKKFNFYAKYKILYCKKSQKLIQIKLFTKKEIKENQLINCTEKI